MGRKVIALAALLSLGVSAVSARSLGGKSFVDYWFDLQSVSVPRVTNAGTISSIVVNDQNVTHSVGATYQDDRQISQVNTVSKNGPGSVAAAWSSSDTSVATVNSSGRVTHVDSNSTGTVTITGTSTALTRTIALNLARVTGATTDTFVNYTTSSLSYHAIHQVDDLISGKTGSNSTWNLFSGTNVRSTTWWGYGHIDLSCHATNGNGGTLVSPRHFIQVSHSPIVAGQTLTFVSNDGSNTVVTRTCLANSSGVVAPDVNVGILSSDVPGTVKFASLLPSSLLNSGTNKFPSVSNGNFPSGVSGVPVVRINQSKQATIGDAAYMALNSVLGYNYFYCLVPSDATRQSFYKDVISGDSGNGCFLIVNGAPVLITCWTYGAGGGGTDYHSYISNLNSVMHTLSAQVSAGTDYQATTADLSAFTSY